MPLPPSQRKKPIAIPPTEAVVTPVDTSVKLVKSKTPAVSLSSQRGSEGGPVWERRWITIQLCVRQDDGTECYEPRQEVAAVLGILAVHPSHHDRSVWTITHLPTQFAVIRQLKTEEDARKLTEVLVRKVFTLSEKEIERIKASVPDWFPNWIHRCRQEGIYLEPPTGREG
jgi:hypothetical protein